MRLLYAQIAHFVSINHYFARKYLFVSCVLSIVTSTNHWTCRIKGPDDNLVIFVRNIERKGAINLLDIAKLRKQ